MPNPVNRRQWLLRSFLAIVACSGCADQRVFDGVIEYRNQSSDKIYVSDVTGFGRRVECGTLPPGTTKGLELLTMPYPKQTTISWRSREEHDQEQTLTLDVESGPHARRNTVLVFEYSAEGKWTARFENKK
jgi:hypothetical protein